MSMFTSAPVLVLSHESALAYWRRMGRTPAATELLAPHEAHDILARSGAGLRSAAVRELATWLAPGALPASASIHEGAERPASDECPTRPLHAITATRSLRRASKLLRITCVQTAPPACSVARCLPDAPMPHPAVGDAHACCGLYVCTPAFAFVQLAATLDIRSTALLGFGLCSRHGGRDALSTPAELQRFAQAAEGLTGAKTARRATRSVLGGSPSFETSCLALLAHFPRTLGGMGAPAPQLGASITLPAAAARTLGSLTCTPALYWPQAKLAVEYSARPWHNNAVRDEYATRIQNAYGMLGIEALLLSDAQLDDPPSTRVLFDAVNRACGTRLRPASERQRIANAELLAWVRAQLAQRHVSSPSLASVSLPSSETPSSAHASSNAARPASSG